MGVKLNDAVNEKRKPKEKKISADDSAIAVWVVPTNEELMIARDTMRLSK